MEILRVRERLAVRNGGVDDLGKGTRISGNKIVLPPCILRDRNLLRMCRWSNVRNHSRWIGQSDVYEIWEAEIFVFWEGGCIAFMVGYIF